MRLVWSQGSSPLTRGKQVAPGERDVDEGLIPAHAGKTRISWFLTCEVGAHPRSRGENLEMRFRFTVAAGSSPLTRGKLLQRERQQGRHGLIPAHAGKTFS